MSEAVFKSRNRGTVLVTGGAGYIGSHAVLALLDAGWPVLVLDNLSTGHRISVDDRATFIRGDVGDEELLASLLAAHPITAIFHFAGSISVPESVDNPLKYYDNNTARTRTLLSAAIAAGVPHFVFSSTAATYGTPETGLISEATPTVPINPYGWSKLMIEQMLADTARAHPINYCALRYFNVAGADPHGRAGQSTKGATHLIKVAAEVVCGKRDEIAIFGNDWPTPDGTGVRDYIHVSDLAAAHVAALEKLIDAPDASLVLNCGYGRGYSVLEVLTAVERVCGHAIPQRIDPRRAGDPALLVADNRKILDTLDWRPTLDDLDMIVAHALRWERQLSPEPVDA